MDQWIERSIERSAPFCSVVPFGFRGEKEGEAKIGKELKSLRAKLTKSAPKSLRRIGNKSFRMD